MIHTLLCVFPKVISDNNGIFPDNFHVSIDQDTVDDKFLSWVPPSVESVDSGLDLVDPSHGLSQHRWFNQPYIQQGLVLNGNFPDDLDHVARCDSQDDPAPRTSYLDPDKLRMA